MTELAIRDSAPLAAWTPSFAVSVDEAVAQVHAKHDFFKKVMRLGDHYAPPHGVTAKAGDPPPKPTLLKPGAELLLANMGLQKELADADVPTIDYGGPTEGLIRYRRVCRIYRQTGPLPEERMLIAQAEGSCSSRETKYRWRTQERACPKCGANAIKTSKFDDGGYYCFNKIGGCGAKFKLGDSAIESQTIGRMPNPDLADVENTILKMADKRALVAATLLATGCSDIFTQDMEDAPGASQRPSDVIDAEFVEDAPAHVSRNGDVSSNISSDDVVAIRTMFRNLAFTEARQSAAVQKMSAGRTTDLAALTSVEGRTLGTYLTRMLREAESKTGHAAPCDVCGATLEADGKTVEHKYDGKGVPCPNDTSTEAQAKRDARAASDRLSELGLGESEEQELAF